MKGGQLTSPWNKCP